MFSKWDGGKFFTEFLKDNDSTKESILIRSDIPVTKQRVSTLTIKHTAANGTKKLSVNTNTRQNILQYKVHRRETVICFESLLLFDEGDDITLWSYSGW